MGREFLESFSTTFTQSALSKDIQQGNIRNPHSFQVGGAYRSQLLQYNSLSRQRWTSNTIQRYGSSSSNNSFSERYGSSSSFNSFSEQDAVENDVNFEPEVDSTTTNVEVSNPVNPMSLIEDHLLPSKYVNAINRYNTIKHRKPPNSVAPERFHYKNILGRRDTALVELLKICDKHEANKAMFDDVLDWVTSWSDLDESGFFKIHSSKQKWTRQTFIEHLTAVFDFGGMKPEKKIVELHDGRRVTVPVIDFEEAVRSLLDDVTVMNNIIERLDPNTWRPKTSAEEHEYDPDAIIGDKESGYLYRQGIDLHCPDESDGIDPVVIRPLPVVIHIDKTHVDVFGNCAVAPIQMMLAMTDVDAQQVVNAWRQIATIPNLNVGKGKDGKKKFHSLNKLKDYHTVLKAAFSSFLEKYEQGGIMWKDTEGRDILLKPYIHMFIGDTAGINEMVGHYNTCYAQCVTKDCKCKFADLTRSPPKCRQMKYKDIDSCSNVREVFHKYAMNGLVSLQDMSEIANDEHLAKSISKHVIDNAFDYLPLSDPYQGIIGMSPQEMLHMMGSGMHKYLIFGIKDVVGENSKNSKRKGLINNLFADVKHALSKNAERDISRTSNRNGVFDVTSLTGEEIRGNFFGLTVMMHTTYGDELFRSCFESKSIDFDEMKKTCLLVLAWERFFMDFNKRSDIELAEQATWDIQDRIQRHIPRDVREKSKSGPGSRGWHIVKYHAMSFIASLNLKFGCAKVFDSSANEKNHKKMVKHHKRRTQMIASKFAGQVGDSDFERLLVDRVYELCKPWCRKDHDPVMSGVITSMERQIYDERLDDEAGVLPDFEDDEIVRIGGQFNLNVDIDASRRISYSTRWKCCHKRRLNIQPNVMLASTIARYSMKYSSNANAPAVSSIKLDCYTTARIGKHTYRATPMWKGEEWYDWISVRFPDSQGEGLSVNCIGRLLGFVRYKTKDSLTYKKMELDKLSLQQARELEDDTLYIIVHCQTSIFKFQHLQKTFIRRYELTDIADTYMLPACMINGPLLCIPNFLSEDTVSTDQFLAILPRHKMGYFFKHYMTDLDAQHKEDHSQQSDDSINQSSDATSGNSAGDTITSDSDTLTSDDLDEDVSVYSDQWFANKKEITKTSEKRCAHKRIKDMAKIARATKTKTKLR